MMKVSYYPGCSLQVTARSYDLSARQVCGILEVELAEIPDWICCGSSPGLKMNSLLSLSLSAKNLARAEKQALKDVVIPCPFCYRRLLSAQQEIERDEDAGNITRQIIDEKVNGGLNIQNLLGFLRHGVGLDVLEAKVRKPLKGLKLIPYYGCYTVKPSQITHFDDPENPTSMDDILTVMGAEVLSWDFKAECCGASLSLSKTEKVCELSGRLLGEAIWRGADAVVVACQLCHANLDMRQSKIWKKGKNHLPILYFTQLMGLAFGLEPKALGLNRHVTDPMTVLKEKGLVS